MLFGMAKYIRLNKLKMISTLAFASSVFISSHAIATAAVGQPQQQTGAANPSLGPAAQVQQAPATPYDVDVSQAQPINPIVPYNCRIDEDAIEPDPKGEVKNYQLRCDPQPVPQPPVALLLNDVTVEDFRKWTNAN